MLRFVPDVFDVDTGETCTATREIADPLHQTHSTLPYVAQLSQRHSEVKQELVEARGQLEDHLACVVCLERTRTVVLRPCCHYVCCAPCAAMQSLCPAAGCFTPITQRLQGVSCVPHMQDFAL